MCKQVIGVSQELGRFCRLHGNQGNMVMPAQAKCTRPAALASRAARSERTMQPWYRQAKETKCGETGGRKS
jgi:hypothetical protein